MCGSRRRSRYGGALVLIREARGALANECGFDRWRQVFDEGGMGELLKVAAMTVGGLCAAYAFLLGLHQLGWVSDDPTPLFGDILMSSRYVFRW